MSLDCIGFAGVDAITLVALSRSWAVRSGTTFPLEELSSAECRSFRVVTSTNNSGGQVRLPYSFCRQLCLQSLFTQPKPGVDEGPIHLVEAGLPEQLRELGWNVTFDGHHQFEEIATADDPPIGILKNPRQVSKVCEAVAHTVGSHAAQGQLPLTLGGDHSLVRVMALRKDQKSYFLVV